MLLNCGVGEDSCESLDCKEIQPVHSEGDQPWDFFGRNDAEAETPVLWPLQGQALRAQHHQLGAQRLHDRFRTIYQTVLSIVALMVLAVIAYAIYSAATDQSVV